ncbi:MAG: M23 family metallopeptidase, partial [Sediminibacterium sp.]|nr:M23 family metallopeptidase [Sediminibacterium sp.]
MYKQNLIQWNDTTIQRAKQKRADILKSGGAGNIKAFNAVQNANKQIIELAEKQQYTNMKISLDSANFMGLNFTLFYDPTNGKTIKLISMNSEIKHRVIYVEYIPTLEHFLAKKTIYESFSGVINMYNHNGILLGKDEFKNGVAHFDHKKINTGINFNDTIRLRAIVLPPGRRRNSLDPRQDPDFQLREFGPDLGFLFSINPGFQEPNFEEDEPNLPDPQDPPVPCEGNPVIRPEITPTDKNKTLFEGGTNGFTRNSQTKYHDGLDIKCKNKEDEIYPMFDGVVVRVKNIYKPGDKGDYGYGNYVIIKSEVNGETIFLKYIHLDYVFNDVQVGTPISRGLTLGVCGTTGNAWNIPNPHVHIQLREGENGNNGSRYEWSGKEARKLSTSGIYEETNPAKYFATLFYNGTNLKPPC